MTSGPSRRSSAAQLAFDLGGPPPAAAQPEAQANPSTSPSRGPLRGTSPSGEEIAIEHRGKRLVLPVYRNLFNSRLSILWHPELARPVIVVPVMQTLDRAETFARRTATRIANWMRGEFRPGVRGADEPVTVEHRGERLALRLRRSRQARRIALRVETARREIVLVVPQRAGREAALKFAQSHAAWIAERLARMPQASPFVDGGEVPLGGVPHRIRHRPDRRGTVWLERGEIHVAGDPRHLPRRLRDWLVQRAGAEMAPLVHAKAKRLAAAGLGRPVTGITIRDTTSRWGSCGADGRIMLSWRMILAPPGVLDYLVAHEVAHLAEHNHSRRFWQVCASLTDGDMATARTWLKRDGGKLLQYGAEGSEATDDAGPDA
jgi:predicted metal-dependent hydrolase